MNWPSKFALVPGQEIWYHEMRITEMDDSGHRNCAWANVIKNLALKFDTLQLGMIGYLATKIILLKRSHISSHYCLFFIHIPQVKILLKTKTKVLEISNYILNSLYSHFISQHVILLRIHSSNESSRYISDMYLNPTFVKNATWFQHREGKNLHEICMAPGDFAPTILTQFWHSQ